MAAKHCRVHANRLTAAVRAKPPPPPKPEQPTKISKHRLDQLRVWKKQHPRGPPCSRPGCENRLMQKSQGKSPPLCMECRASTGQLARGLAAAARPPMLRGAGGVFLTKARTPPAPPAPSPDTDSGS